MEEKILIQSKPYNVKKFFIIMVIIGAVLSAIMMISEYSECSELFDEYYMDYLRHNYGTDCYSYGDQCFRCERLGGATSAFSFAMSEISEELPMFLTPVAFFALIGWLIYLWLRSYELTVTGKRVYGRVAWGKRVDLPVDSVSAISTIQLFRGVSVSTSSGRISFRLIKNSNEIYRILNELLIERQQAKASVSVAAPVAAAPTIDGADQLKKYKDLLDSGVITAEEFDAKKKQILGL